MTILAVLLHEPKQGFPNAFSSYQPRIVSQLEIAFAYDIPYRIRKRLVHLNREICEQVTFWPLREKPNLIVQSHTRVLDVTNIPQPLPKLLQLVCGDESVANLDAFARFLLTTGHDHFTDQVIESLARALVGQLIGRESSAAYPHGSVIARVENISCALILPHIP